MAVITASGPEWIAPFTGLTPVQFRRLVRLVARRGGAQVADGRRCRPWALPLADRVLLVAAYWRTNLTMRQIAPLFGVSSSTAHRVIDTLGPHLGLARTPDRGPRAVAIVDGTLVPTRDRSLAASSKNYRYSTNLQVAINADTQLVIAVGRPLPGNRNDCRAYAESGIDRDLAGRAVMADGGYQGTGLIMPYRRRGHGHELTSWQERHNTTHRRIRARVEHCFAKMKRYTILRDYRRKASTLHTTALGIASLVNLARTD